MPLRRLGISNYRLFWRRQVQANDEENIEKRFLPQFLGDPSAMRDLRALLDESTGADSQRQTTDNEVMAGIARLLESGELLVVKDWVSHGGNATKPESATPGPPPGNSPGPASKSQQEEDPTLPPSTDGAAQAGSLTNAAASGAPFCEH
jgi:hypothetical protein